MSYIHKALRKAQREKDSHHYAYDGVLATQGRKNLFSGRPVLLGSLVSIAVLLALAFYLRSDPKVIKTAEEEIHHEKPVPTLAGKQEKSPPSLKNSAGTPTQTKHKAPPIPDRNTTSKTVNPKQVFERARMFQRDGRLKDAKRLYQQVLKTDPNYVDALNNLGVIFIHEKDYQTAQTYFEKAARLQPKNVDPYYNLACVHSLKGEKKLGISNLKKACSLNKAVKHWARTDTDLINLKGIPEFENLIRNSSDSDI